MQPADGVLDIVMFQQAAAFSPKLGELDVDGIQLGGAGIRVQQPGCLQLTDVMALLGGLGNGPVDLQHGGVFPLQGALQVIQLGQGRFQDDVRVGPEFVVHPNEGGVDLCFRYPAHWTACRIPVVFSARPSHQTATPRPTAEHSPALAAPDLPDQGGTGVFHPLPCALPLEQLLYFFKCLSGHDSGMCIFNVILVGFAVVSPFEEWETTGEVFLVQGVTDVLLVGQDIENGCFLPVWSIVRSWNSSLFHLFRNPLQTFS